jgi:hypothetical protein
MLNPLETIIDTVILSRALYVCCDFNIPDILQDSPMTLEDLNNTIACNKNALLRLMRVLSLNKFFRIKDSHFYNTDLGHTLCKNHPNSLRPFLLHEDETRWR